MKNAATVASEQLFELAVKELSLPRDEVTIHFDLDGWIVEIPHGLVAAKTFDRAIEMAKNVVKNPLCEHTCFGCDEIICECGEDGTKICPCRVEL